jgi:hypothetical protein
MKFRWEEKLNNLLATKSKADLLEVWDRVNKERKRGSTLSEYFEKLEEWETITQFDPPRFEVKNNLNPLFSGVFLLISHNERDYKGCFQHR